ncbi:aspartate--tRNA ligase 2, cytoplasmic-like isoform X2 [Macadamia integrifolia]|uniref:aspartate--tRNA ligase 2, cytoplasmic-like isoform X2 n=1 Tax=Macadamia integrifolia TaxID=60698 RepID=UPI001C527EC8|nr:aspartate--tRNA ligase 2, cytoplasmic-like isoform X2 [Macadamia integrifolia]
MEIKEHYFEYLRKTLRLTFQEGVRMLKAGVEVDPLGDLNTEAERKLDQLVCDKYDTDFYILHGYPLAVRPFYTMLCYNDSAYSEEIISGPQRIHEPEFLTTCAMACGIEVKTISLYIDSFRGGIYVSFCSPSEMFLETLVSSG